MWLLDVDIERKHRTTVQACPGFTQTFNQNFRPWGLCQGLPDQLPYPYISGYCFFGMYPSCCIDLIYFPGTVEDCHAHHGKDSGSSALVWPTPGESILSLLVGRSISESVRGASWFDLCDRLPPCLSQFICQLVMQVFPSSSCFCEIIFYEWTLLFFGFKFVFKYLKKIFFWLLAILCFRFLLTQGKQKIWQ